MKTKETGTRSIGFGRRSLLIFILINVLILASVSFFFTHYVDEYKEKIVEENVSNISNINNTSANTASTIINNWNITLKSVSSYINSLHDSSEAMTYNEVLEYLSKCNIKDNLGFQVIKNNYTGDLIMPADENDINDDVNNNSYKDANFIGYTTYYKYFDDYNDSLFSEVCLLPEFTGNDDLAIKTFAIYKHIKVSDEVKPCTLLLTVQSKFLLDTISFQNKYNEQRIVIINKKGDYTLNDNSFSNNNIYSYIRKCNNVSQDYITELKNNVVNVSDSGILYYKSNTVTPVDSIYVYEKLKISDWYCITCVPISSYHEATFQSKYMIIIVFTMLLLLGIDIFWMQKINKNLRMSSEREKEANRAKGNFMSRMSHEIRTPLNAVIGYNTIASSSLTNIKDEFDYRQVQMKVMDCLNKSSIASKHLLTVINDVLDMSTIESGRIKIAKDKFDLKTLISSLTTVFYAQLKSKKVNFEVVFDTVSDEWFLGDQLRINQVLTNLLSNATKFTPEYGQVKMIISNQDINDKEVLFTFVVTDTGIGMSEEYLTHIWTPFEQADSSISRRFGGTGLGLSITKNLVNLMNGSIDVASKEGQGTTFTVKLKLEKVEQPKVVLKYDFTTVNALIVDDDVSTCEYISKLFTKCGAKSEYSITGENALEKFTNKFNSNNPYNICLVDWQMPIMNGIEVVKEIRKIAGNDLPIIVISAYDYSEIIDKAKEANIKMFISKPLFQSTLFDLLANICGKEIDISIGSEENLDFHNQRIILAEDNEMNMEIAKQLLESVNLSVDCAWNGNEVISLFESSPVGTYKLILMDVHMPVMNGHDATIAIRSSNRLDSKTIPIIAMTADAFSENVKEALDSGMNDHVAKPIDTHILFEKIGKYLKENK